MVDKMSQAKPAVNLNELIDAFDIQSDTLTSYVNKKTGEIVLLQEDEIDSIEDSDDKEIPFDDFPKWQHESLMTAKDVLTTDNYIELPSQWDIDKYQIMEDFCRSIENPKMRESLLKAISGKGAFGKFHASVHCFEIEKEWYEYLRNELKEKAIDWCQENNFDFE